MQKLLVICGPTATGKTKLALNLAKRFDGELVSADSRQVYKGLDALTGKDRPEGRDGKIWMYDAVDIGSDFSVSQYARMAEMVIDDIRKRGKLPIAVGGTGLYLKAITQPLPFIHIPPNPWVREKFQDQPKEILQRELQKVDRRKWERMNASDRNNPRRLLRALEIAMAANVSQPKEEVFDTLWIGLTAPKMVLEERIRKNVSERFDEAADEVRAMRSNPSTVPVVIIGIPIISDCLRGSVSKEEAIERWTKKEFRYAKRQLTWFKKQPDIHWVDITSSQFEQEAAGFVSSWYTNSNDVED